MVIKQDEKDIFRRLEREEIFLDELENYLEDEARLESFFKSILSKPDFVKLVVLDFLFRSAKSRHLKHLISWLKKETAERIVARILVVSGNIADASVLNDLTPFLHHPERRIRANAVETIGKIQSEESREALMHMLDDSDNRVRANAAMALWCYENLQDEIREIFFGMLENKDKWMKASAIYAFGELGIGDFIDYLFNFLLNEDEDICRNALVALLGFAEKNNTGKGSENGN